MLNEVHEGDLLRFRCQVEHAYAPEALYLQQSAQMEGALWAALEEQASLARRMAVRARELGQARSSARHDERAQAAEAHARMIRDALKLGAPPRGEQPD